MTCLPCDLEGAAAEEIIHRDDLWSCEIADGYDVPGWFILRVRRHAQGWASLAAEEAAALGVVAQRVAAAIEKALGTPTTYVMTFGENYPHVHFLVIGRPADLPVEDRGAAILSRRLTHRDRQGALAAAAAVRAALHD